MQGIAGAYLPAVSIDRSASKPLHSQLYEAYRDAIESQRLLPGQQAPSTRELASLLGLSRTPILSAYSQLIAEGYFESRPGTGTYVGLSLPERLINVALVRRPTLRNHLRDRTVSKRSEVFTKLQNADRPLGWGAFNVGQLALDHFPFRIWSNLVNRHCRKIRVSLLHLSDPAGSLEFRKTLSIYLRTTRAVDCEPEQILITSGASQQALEIAANVLLEPGDRVWMEDPGYHRAWQPFRLAGCQLIPVPVDEEGLSVAVGIKQCRKARAVYATPSHQFPLGVAMTMPRRLELLDWAQSTGAWIIEDDYDSAYRYGHLPIPCLQGVDRNLRVIHVGTFSRTLFPSLRLGYLVVPADLVDRFVAVRQAMDICPSHLYQAVVNDLIGEGYLARHIRCMRTLYGTRRAALIEALEEQFDGRVKVVGGDAGLHLVAELPSRLQDVEISERAARRKLWLWPLSSCFLSPKRRQGLILGFGGTATKDIPNEVQRLRETVHF